MRQIATIVLLVCGLAGSAVTAAWAAEQRAQPYELVRSLRALQDRAVRGDAAAHSEQRRLSVYVAEQMIGAEPEVWSDPKNVRAVVIYTLSGGDPRALKSLFSLPSLPGVGAKLLNGALAYAEGRDADAAELLAEVDARALEPNLGAHVALVQSILLAKKDAKAAMALLDDARLLSPGTLVEEAALRRKASAIAAGGDMDAYNALASHYMRRFPNSIYAGGFREQFATEIASKRYQHGSEQLSRLEAMLDGLDIATRRECYLLISHQAVIGGRVELARLAARQAVALTREGSKEHTRSRIYEAAVLVVTEDYDAGIEVLKSMDRSTLDAQDEEFVEAAMAVADAVRQPPSTSDPQPVDAASTDTSPPKTVERAKKIIAQVDTLLNEASR